MTSKNIRLLCGAAILVALGAGFGLAQLIPHTEHAAHTEGDDHAAHDDHDEHDAHDEHDHEPSEEGVVVLTARQIEASGIRVVSVGHGGGTESRLSGRVESAVDARAVVAAITGGRVEQIHVAPGSSVEAGQLLAVIVSGEAATLRANADAAVAEAEAARLAYQRDLNLVEQGLSLVRTWKRLAPAHSPPMRRQGRHKRRSRQAAHQMPRDASASSVQSRA